MAYYHNPRPKKVPKKESKDIIEAPKKPRGRPLKEVDLGIAENLCLKQLTAEEIAGILNITVETLNSRISAEYNENYSEWKKRVCSSGLGQLRESMWDMAVNDKNTTMAIWLSKQYLGMRDSFEEPKPEIKPVMIVWQDKRIELSATQPKELPDGKETSTKADAET